MTTETTHEEHDDGCVRQLVEQGEHWFSTRCGQNWTIVIDSTGKIYRSVEEHRITNPVLPEDLQDGNRFGQISSVSQMMQRLFFQPDLGKRKEWTSIQLPLATVKSASLLHRICAELDAEPEFEIHADAIPGDLDHQFVQNQALVSNERLIRGTIACNAVTALCKATRTRTRLYQDCDGLLVIGYVDQVLYALQMTTSGRVTSTQLFTDLFQSIIAPERSALLELERSIAETGPQCRRHVREMLGQVSPRLDRAMALSLVSKRPVVIRVAVVEIRPGVPVSLWIIVSANTTMEESGYCTILVHRPEREFILEACGGDKFYFPPCQLVAQIQIQGVSPTLAFPTIRQPVGGFGHSWQHPYSGALHRRATSDLIGTSSSDDPAVYNPSPQALRLFSGLGTRSNAPYVGDLCLNDQRASVTALRSRLGDAIRGASDERLIDIITEVHDIVRLGLTRAHEMNGAAPRTVLSAKQMPFPVSRRRLTGTLAKRVFPYNSTRGLGVCPF